MTTEMVKAQPQSVVTTMDDAERAARAMAASGFFADTREAAQALVKILAGQEMGFGPFAAMTNVHIIKGKPTLSANLMAAAVKRTGRYNYRILHLDDTGCEIAFFESGSEVGRSSFTQADAQKAGLLGKDTWRQYPRNLYFARAMSNGARWYAPDAMGGAPVYTPEELDAVIVEEPEHVEHQPAPAAQPKPATRMPTPAEDAAWINAPDDPTTPPKPVSKPAAAGRTLYTDAGALRDRMRQRAQWGEDPDGRCTLRLDTDAQTNPAIVARIAATLNKALPKAAGKAEDNRHAIYWYLFGVERAEELTNAEAQALLAAWENSAQSYTANEWAMSEVPMVLERAQQTQAEEAE